MTQRFLGFPMPQSETAFEGIGACLLPLPDKQLCLVPSISAGWFTDTVWYRYLCFHLIHNEIVAGLDPEQAEAATLPQEPESCDVIIRSGRYPT